VSWRLGDGSRLELVANLGSSTVEVLPATGTRLFATTNLDSEALAAGRFPPWSATWHLHTKDSP